MIDSLVDPTQLAYYREQGLMKKRISTVTDARSGSSGEKDENLYKACVEFESLFIKQMLDAMRQTVTKSGLIGGGMAEEIFEDFLYDEYAMKMAETAGFGLSDTLYNQLSRNRAYAG
jgi:flagellar protein FlgJ